MGSLFRFGFVCHFLLVTTLMVHQGTCDAQNDLKIHLVDEIFRNLHNFTQIDRWLTQPDIQIDLSKIGTLSLHSIQLVPFQIDSYQHALALSSVESNLKNDGEIQIRIPLGNPWIGLIDAGAHVQGQANVSSLQIEVQLNNFTVKSLIKQQQNASAQAKFKLVELNFEAQISDVHAIKETFAAEWEKVLIMSAAESFLKREFWHKLANAFRPTIEKSVGEFEGSHHSTNSSRILAYFTNEFPAKLPTLAALNPLLLTTEQYEGALNGSFAEGIYVLSNARFQNLSNPIAKYSTERRNQTLRVEWHTPAASLLTNLAIQNASTPAWNTVHDVQLWGNFSNLQFRFDIGLDDDDETLPLRLDHSFGMSSSGHREYSFNETALDAQVADAIKWLVLPDREPFSSAFSKVHTDMFERLEQIVTRLIRDDLLLAH